MKPLGWLTLASAGFWMAILGALIMDGLLASVGAVIFGGSIGGIVGQGRDRE